ncbi:U11/U12 small nuclear ribonucleoprotein 25 kDa protein isoform X2 [Bicyclus anynana]|uniref:U11/U12 small nuclear ribonucleoprotein 25 kDa protein isoform X2 n=1 Tax=Bicyclus anynana TaxID=110368 RepID=A0A6J1NT40_BICAN|nr:U11/U12 small nuclear ribonucleoprotein 25 kDa protein isoform X2 [Bicyclus anynana]
MEEIAEVAETLSHDDLLEITKSSLVNLLRSDSLLSDLPSDIILEEIISLVAQNATVRELKKAIARHFEIHQQRTGNKVKISWKYIWRTYDLSFDSIILDDNSSFISNYGVTNKVTLNFKKKRKKPKQ